jgi:hypothetical protein
MVGTSAISPSAAAKKKGVKSTLGRIFGKKDKQLKAALKDQVSILLRSAFEREVLRTKLRQKLIS